MPEVDQDLVDALKVTKGKKANAPMYFAFIPIGGSDGTLLISKSKIPDKEIKDAKQEVGGGKEVKGRCFGEGKTIVFKVGKPPPASMNTALKKVMRDTKLGLLHDLQFSADVDLEEGGPGALPPGAPPLPATGAPAVAAAAAGLKGGTAAAAGARPASAPPAPAAAPPAAPGAEAAAKPPTAQELAVLEDRRRDFKKARAAWVAVKNKAEEDLEKVKDGAHMTYLADPEQFPKIVKGCKDIDDILDNLDDELRDTLDQYASTPLKNQTKLRSLAATATKILDRYGAYVESNPLMKALDAKEFADVVIHAPIKKALADLKKALS
jgi:hypothetical protein